VINFFSINQLHLRQYEYNHKTPASLPDCLTKQPGGRQQSPNLRKLGKFIHIAIPESSRPVGFRRS